MTEANQKKLYEHFKSLKNKYGDEHAAAILKVYPYFAKGEPKKSGT